MRPDADILHDITRTILFWKSHFTEVNRSARMLKMYGLKDETISPVG